MGFTFDDTDNRGIANPISLMRELIQKDPRNAERIFPFLGGEEINDNSNHAAYRYIINFEKFPLLKKDLGYLWIDLSEEKKKSCIRSGIVPIDYPFSVAYDWPDLIKIVEEKVKGTRGSHSTAPWWQYERPRIELNVRLNEVDKALVTALTSNTFAFVFAPSKTVFSHSVVVFPQPNIAEFSILQSRIHEYWSKFQGSTMKDDSVYTPTDCYETYPFPVNFENSQKLSDVGVDYYELREKIMQANNEGLTKTYNRFHDPEETSEGILRLRELHSAMDRAVLNAYGWDEIQPTCEFLLEYEDEEDEDESSGRTRKKPWRYRWPDQIRDEVLARLLALNEERAKEEQLAGLLKEPTVEYGTKKKKN